MHPTCIPCFSLSNLLGQLHGKFSKAAGGILGLKQSFPLSKTKMLLTQGQLTFLTLFIVFISLFLFPKLPHKSLSLNSLSLVLLGRNLKAKYNLKIYIIFHLFPGSFFASSGDQLNATPNQIQAPMSWAKELLTHQLFRKLLQCPSQL